MTLYEYKLLSLDEQAEAAWNGVFLADRTVGERKYALYAVLGFYAEVCYNASENVIEDIKSFRSGGVLLDPYLQKIDISGVMS